LKKLDRKRPFGTTVKNMSHPNRKYIQDGLHYGIDEILILTPEALAAGYTIEDTIPEGISETVDPPDEFEKQVEASEEAVKNGITFDTFKQQKKPEYIIPKSGRPYKTEDVAWVNLKRKKLSKKDHIVVPYEEGFAIVKKV